MTPRPPVDPDSDPGGLVLRNTLDNRSFGTVVL
nr:MAG TPA: hypothetical protein [Caudoviricetes sp.]